MPRPFLRWIIGAGIGISLIMAGYLFLYPKYFSPQAKVAKQLGIPPSAYVEVNELEMKSGKNKKLSESEVERLKNLAENENSNIRNHAVSALGYLADSDQAENARDIVRSKLNDPEREVRLLALKALFRLKATDIGSVAQKMMKDSDENVRSKAEDIYKKVTNGS